MANTVLVPSSIKATNVDSLNVNVVASSDTQNGAVFQLGALSTTSGQGEVFTIAAPATDALSNLYMAYSPEVVVLVSGSNKFKGLDQNPHNFTNISGVVFNAFKPQVGDIIAVSKEGFTGGTAPTLAQYANAANGVTTLTAGASQTASALSFKCINASYPVAIANGTIANQREAFALLQCVAN